MELVSFSHAKGQLVYHLGWCPKYRYKMFRKPENAAHCEKTLREVASRHGIKILEISVMPEHVHVAACIPPNMAVSKAMQILKGGSSYTLVRCKPNFRKRYPKGHLWSRGKFYRTIGDVDLTTTISYIKEQKTSQTTLTQYSHF